LTYDEVRQLLQRLRSKSKVQILLKAPPPGTAPSEPASAPPGAGLRPAESPGAGLSPAVAGPPKANPVLPAPKHPLPAQKATR
jgi:peptidyl-prolyl cis-trans isomerase C